MKRGRYLLLTLLLLLTSGYGNASDVLKVWCSGGLMPVLKTVVADWQQRSGINVEIEAAPSMGQTPQSVPQRLAHHQQADVLVMVEAGMRPLVAQGWIAAADSVALADSWIALAVPAGQTRPDNSTAQALRATLLHARRVAYSDSASGRYVSGELFRRLGIAQAMRAKSLQVPATPVGAIVAEGQADIGFQQLSELQAVRGIEVVGLLPASLQKATRYAAVIVRASRHQEAGRAFIRYLVSAKVAAVIREKGMDPLGVGH